MDSLALFEQSIDSQKSNISTYAQSSSTSECLQISPPLPVKLLSAKDNSQVKTSMSSLHNHTFTALSLMSRINKIQQSAAIFDCIIQHCSNFYAYQIFMYKQSFVVLGTLHLSIFVIIKNVEVFYVSSPYKSIIKISTITVNMD